VKKGNIGATPEKRGEKGSIPVKAYKALCGAFESFVKLAAQEGKQSLKQPVLIQKMNACVNARPDEKRTGQKLFERVQATVAATLDL
jgi:hypothetical protein